MSKPYDAVSKRLIELRPADWVQFLGLPPGPVSLVDADLSTISTFADRLIRVDATVPYFMHNELESGKDTAAVPIRLFHYNGAAYYKLRLPVLSSVFLLHKGANSPQITGELLIRRPDGNPYVTFTYNVVRVWLEDVEKILAGGLATLPLAPIAKVTQASIPQIIQKMEQRIEAEAADGAEAAELWTATNVLMGLRYNKTFKAQVLQGVRRMRESITYKEILEEGAEEGAVREARRLIIRTATRRLGVIPPVHEAKLQAIDSLILLEMIHDRLLEAETWDELLRGF